jgi:hypothetical protein
MPNTSHRGRGALQFASPPTAAVLDSSNYSATCDNHCCFRRSRARRGTAYTDRGAGCGGAGGAGRVCCVRIAKPRGRVPAGPGVVWCWHPWDGCKDGRCYAGTVLPRTRRGLGERTAVPRGGSPKSRKVSPLPPWLLAPPSVACFLRDGAELVTVVLVYSPIQYL